MAKASDLWLEFLGGDLPGVGKHLCGLCGNTGVVDTRGRIASPVGHACGVRAFCICPNGRAWKKSGADITRLPSGNV